VFNLIIKHFSSSIFKFFLGKWIKAAWYCGSCLCFWFHLTTVSQLRIACQRGY